MHTCERAQSTHVWSSSNPLRLTSFPQHCISAANSISIPAMHQCGVQICARHSTHSSTNAMAAHLGIQLRSSRSARQRLQPAAPAHSSLFQRPGFWYCAKSCAQSSLALLLHPARLEGAACWCCCWCRCCRQLQQTQTSAHLFSSAHCPQTRCSWRARAESRCFCRRPSCLRAWSLGYLLCTHPAADPDLLSHPPYSCQAVPAHEHSLYLLVTLVLPAGLSPRPPN